MNVSLTPELEKYIQDRVQSGQYASASEVIREALRLHQTQDPFANLDKNEVQRLIQEGLEDIKAGRYYTGTVREHRDRILNKAKLQSKPKASGE